MTVEDRVDAVIHMAWPASPTDYLRWSIETLEGAEPSAHCRGLEKDAAFFLAPTPETYGDPKV